MNKLILALALVALISFTQCQSDLQNLKNDFLKKKNITSCSGLQQECGHELEHLKCCDGYECVNNSTLRGSKGKCVKKATNKTLCAKQNDVCGHEKNQSQCCNGFQCIKTDSIFGAAGRCVNASLIRINISNQTQQNQSVCSQLNQTCGHEREHQKCCEGYVCNVGQNVGFGSKGVCVKRQQPQNNTQVCGRLNDTCGHELDHQKCCEGFGCVRKNQSIGGLGKCVKLYQSNHTVLPNFTNHSVQPSFTNHSVQPNFTNHTKLPIISNHTQLNNNTNHTQKPINNNTCALLNQTCGHEKGHQKCCDGFECKINLSSGLGSKGVCVKQQKQNSTQVCSQLNQTCGHELGHNKCCQGYSCKFNTAVIGSQGRCVRN